jgi:hypothetical protein
VNGHGALSKGKKDESSRDELGEHDLVGMSVLKIPCLYMHGYPQKNVRRSERHITSADQLLSLPGSLPEYKITMTLRALLGPARHGYTPFRTHPGLDSFFMQCN